MWVEGPRLTERLQEAIPPLHGCTGLSLGEPQVLVVAHLKLGPQPAVDSLVVELLPRVAGQPEEAAHGLLLALGITNDQLADGLRRGEQAIIAEFEGPEARQEDKDNLDYVLRKKVAQLFWDFKKCHGDRFFLSREI